MRQVFSSPRLENVESVAGLLRDAGIQVKVTHGRSYRGGLRGDFSYRDGADGKPMPAVWVVLSEDQPKARALLREQGLLDSTRTDTGYRLPAFRTELEATRDDAGRKRMFRLKAGLMLAIGVVLALVGVSQLGGGDAPVPSSPARTAPMLPPGDSPTPDALAIAVLAGELPTAAGDAVCLSVDGADPAPSLLAALPAGPGQVIALSQCPATDVPRLAISSYRAGPSGAGAITLERRTRAGAPAIAETYEVSRNDRGWRVVELL